MEHLISVDIGTTALKASLIRRDGAIAESASRTYPLIARGSAVEQDPRLWWDAFCSAVMELVGTCPDIAAVTAAVLSGQMQDLAAIRDGDSLGNAILYSDTRAWQEAETIDAAFPPPALTDIACNIPDAASIAPKILHARSRMWGRHEPQAGLSRGGGELGQNTLPPAEMPDLLLFGAHDYVCWKLTGKAVTDFTTASTTGLMNYRSNSWNRALLAYLSIDESCLPILTPAGSISGYVTARASRACGLPAGMPVIHGAGDAGASTIGVGAGVAGTVSCSLGTSGWIAATVDAPCDPSKGIFNLKHPDGCRTVSIGAMRTTGGNLSWLLETIPLGDDPYRMAAELALQAPAGCGGLIYLPYLQGERSPFNDPHSRGAFIGLSRQTGQAELYRAVLEGICFGLADIHQALFSSGSTAAPFGSASVGADSRIAGSFTGNRSQAMLIASGGGARNLALTRILASVTGIPVLVAADAANSGNRGNLIIAGHALGWFDSFSLPPGFLRIERRVDPDPAEFELYQRYRESFTRIYQSLRCEFETLAHISQYNSIKGEGEQV